MIHGYKGMLICKVDPMDARLNSLLTNSYFYFLQKGNPASSLIPHLISRNSYIIYHHIFIYSLDSDSRVAIGASVVTDKTSATGNSKQLGIVGLTIEKYLSVSLPVQESIILPQINTI